MEFATLDELFSLDYKPSTTDIPSLIDESAVEFDVDPVLIQSQSRLESGQDASQTSDAGAVGVMQILPSTAQGIAAELGEAYSPQKLRDPKTNIRWGTYHMKTLVNKFGGDRQLALGAYLGGEQGVRDALAKHPTKQAALESIVDKYTGMNAWDYGNNILSGGGVKTQKRETATLDNLFAGFSSPAETTASEETPEGFKPVTKVPHPEASAVTPPTVAQAVPSSTGYEQPEPESLYEQTPEEIFTSVEDRPISPAAVLSEDTLKAPALQGEIGQTPGIQPAKVAIEGTKAVARMPIAALKAINEADKAQNQKAVIRLKKDIANAKEVGDDQMVKFYQGKLDRVEDLLDVSTKAAEVTKKLVESGFLKAEDIEKAPGIQGWIQDAIRMGPQVLSQAAVHAATGGLGGLVFMGAQIAGGKTEELEKEGVDPETSLIAGLGSAAVQAPLERIGMTKALQVWQPGKVAKKALKEIIESGGTEFITEALQEYPDAIASIWAKNKDKPLREQADLFIKDFWNITKEALYSGSLGAAMGAGTAGLGVASGKSTAISETQQEMEKRTQSDREKLQELRERAEELTETTAEGIEVLPGGKERIEEATQKGLAEAGITPAQDVVETAKPEETAPLSKEALSGAQRPTLNIPTTKKVEALAAQSETDLVEAVTGLNKFLPVEDKLSIETESKQLKKDFDHQIDIMQGRVEAETKKVPTERRKEAVPSEQKRRKEDVKGFDETTKPTAVEPTIKEEVVEKELPTIKEIEAKKESIAPDIKETAEEVEKQPWEMSQKDFVNQEWAKTIGQKSEGPAWGITENKLMAQEHERLVNKAIEEGKTVPPEILKEYPKLQEKAGATKPPETKKPWEMKREEFRDVVLEKDPLQRVNMKEWLDSHKVAVEKAVKEGKKVSPEVLKDYPDLIAKPTKTPAKKPSRDNYRAISDNIYKYKDRRPGVIESIPKPTSQEIKYADTVKKHIYEQNTTFARMAKEFNMYTGKGKKKKQITTGDEFRKENPQYKDYSDAKIKKIFNKHSNAANKRIENLWENPPKPVRDAFDALQKPPKPLTKKQKEAKRVAEKIDRDEKAFKEEMGTEKQKIKTKIAQKKLELAKKRAEAKLTSRKKKKKKKEEPDVLFKKGEPVAFKESISEVKKAVSPQLWDKVDIKFATGFGLKGKRTLKKDETGAIWEEKGRLKVVINPSATSDKIAATLFHEVAGHAGAANVLRSNPEIHKKISSLYKGTKKGKLQEKIRRAYKSELKDLSPEAQNDLVFAEWIATNVEEHLANPKKKGVAYQVWKAVKKFLTDLGITKENVDDVINKMTKEIRKISDVTAKISEKPLFSKDTEVRKELSFYSPTARKISELKQEKGVVPQIQSMIKKGQLKKAEVEWMGLEEFLKENPKATKTEVQDFVKANEVTVEESALGEELFANALVRQEELTKIRESRKFTPQEAEEFRELSGSLDKAVEKRETKYSQHTLPGGENYRELLFKMPERVPIFSEYAISKGFTQKQAKEFFNLGGTDEKLQKVYDEWSTKRNKYLAEGKYKSSHWDEPNVFAHARVNDRTTPEGEKVLFIEEIQSDWAREARERGIKDPERAKKREKLEKKLDKFQDKIKEKYGGLAWWGKATNEERQEFNELNEKLADLGAQIEGVPDFPFRKNWQEFALKNLLKRAVSEGYDRISWVTGEQTADRYDLSKHLSKVSITRTGDNQYSVSAFDKNSDRVIDKDGLSGDELASHVGKDLAETAIQDTNGGPSIQNYEGLDLKIGGEWAKNLYDKQIPSFLKKYAKKWDAKVEETPLNIRQAGEYDEATGIMMNAFEVVTTDGRSDYGFYGNEKDAKQGLERAKEKFPQQEWMVLDNRKHLKSTQLSLPITPSMKESIIDEGQPMFSKELKEPGYIEKLRETGDAIPESLKDKVLRRLQDRHNRVKTIQELIADDIPDDLNTYLNIDVMTGKQEHQLKEFHKNEIIPFEKDLAGFKGDLKKAEEFAYAQHANERNKTVKERRYSTTGEALGELESKVLDKTETLMERAEELGGKKADLQSRLKTEALSDTQKTRMNERIAVIDKSLNSINSQVDKMNTQLEKMGVKVEQFKRVTESGSGMSKEEAQAIFDAAEAEGMTEEYKKLADQIVEINKQTSKIELEAGLISQKTYDDRKKWSHYVPLMGLDEADPVRARGSQGFDIRGKEFQAALGRNSRASNILAHSIMKRNQAVTRGETNKVAQVFKRFIDANPNPDMWEINEVVTKPFLNKKTGEVEMRQVREFELTQAEQDRILHVKVDGKPYEITIKDEILGRAMKDLGTEKLNKGLQVMARVNRHLAMINTMLDPQFIVNNFIRDIQAMGLNITADESAKLAFKVGKNTPKAVASIYNAERGKTGTEYIDYYNEWKEAGGKIGFMGIKNVDQIQKDLLGEISQMKPGSKAKAMKAYKAVGKFIENANSAVESGVRLSTYIEMRKKGVSKLKAATISKNVTVNFNKKGELGPALNALYLFANASIQGSWRMGTAMLKTKKGRAMIAGMIATGAGLSELARWTGGEDDDGVDYYDKVPPWIKEKYFVFMRPGIKTLDKDGFLNSIHYVKIPMPYGYNVFHSMGVAIDDVAHDPTKENTLKNAGFVTGALMDAFNPLGTAASFLQTITPSAARWATDLGLNRDYKGAPIAVEQHYGVKKAKSHTSKKKTSEQSKAVAKAFNQISGGTKYEKGWGDFSPDQLDYVGEFLTGGAGRTVSQVGNLGIELGKAAVKKEKPDLALQEIPFARRVLGEIPEFQNVGDFYDNTDKLKEVRKQFDDYKKEKSKKELPYLKKNRGLLKLTEKRDFVIINKKGKYVTVRSTKLGQWEKELRKLRDRRDRFEKKNNTEKVREVNNNIQKKVKLYNKLINEAK